MSLLTAVSKDALHYALSFLTIRDLNSMIAVCRGSSGVVCSALSMCVSYHVRSYPDDLVSLLGSPLARRHIGALRLYRCTRDLMEQISILLTQLRSLNVSINPNPAEEWILPLRLTKLIAYCSPSSTGLPATVASLRSLNTLLIMGCPDLPLSPLVEMTTLTDLTFDGGLNDEQTEAIRAMPALLRLSVDVEDWRNPEPLLKQLDRLTRVPHEMKLESLLVQRVDVSDTLTAMLPRLPTLRSLPSMWSSMTSFAFLSLLPQLTFVELRLYPGSRAIADELVTALRPCVLIERVLFNGIRDLTSEHLEAIFARLPRLHTISLYGLDSLTTLQFLTRTPSLIPTLRLLSIEACTSWELKGAEVDRLRPFHSLTSFTVTDSFCAYPIPDEMRAALRLPSAWLPLLESFKE